MKVFKSILFFGLLAPAISSAQYNSKLNAGQWTDSVFNSLNDDEKIAQLMVIRAHSNLGADHVTKVVNDIQKYNVGALVSSRADPSVRLILLIITKALPKRR